MDCIAKRIKEAMNEKEMKQAELVSLTKISKGALSSYISGKYEPKQTNIYKLAKALGVNEAWLMGYDVPMNTNQSLHDTYPLILDYYNSLNDIGKHEATKRVEELTYIPIYKKHLEVNAAHERTDIEITEEMRKHDDDIMNDENF